MALRQAGQALGLRMAPISVAAARSMSKVVDGLKYMKSHEWAKAEGETATVGITEHAAGELGDIVYAELPEVGQEVKQGESFGTMESVKAASDVYAPVSGKVEEVNGDLMDNPGKVNEDPFGQGWMMKVKMHNSSELNSLLDANAYKAEIGSS